MSLNINVSRLFLNLNSFLLDGNTILKKVLAIDKLGILDIKVILENKIPCDIKVQVVPFNNLLKRLV